MSTNRIKAKLGSIPFSFGQRYPSKHRHDELGQEAPDAQVKNPSLEPAEWNLQVVEEPVKKAKLELPVHVGYRANEVFRVGQRASTDEIVRALPKVVYYEAHDVRQSDPVLDYFN